MYKLLISKYIPNPKYEEEWQKYKEDEKNRDNYYSGRLIPRPAEDIFEKDLEVMLTDGQWEAVKKAVLGQF